MLAEQLRQRGVPVSCVTPRLFAACAETDTPQGILLLLQRPPRRALTDLVHAAEKAPLYLALDRVQDPGNVGMILRTADAAGAAGVILLRGCADVYSSKVVRATMGSLFYVPFISGVDDEELLSFAQERELYLYASERLLGACQHLYVPMCGQAESLNVASAATAILYESMRQRNYAGI